MALVPTSELGAESLQSRQWRSRSVVSHWCVERTDVVTGFGKKLGSQRYGTQLANCEQNQ